MREVADPIYRAAAGLACVPGKGGAAETRRESRPGVAGADASGKEVPTTGAGESARGRRKRVTCGAAGESLTSRPGLSMGGRAARPSWAERRELGYGPDGGWCWAAGARTRPPGKERSGPGKGKEGWAAARPKRGDNGLGWFLAAGLVWFRFGLGWVAFGVWVFYFFSSFLFPISTKLNLFESKFEFEFKPHSNQ